MNLQLSKMQVTEEQQNTIHTLHQQHIVWHLPTIGFVKRNAMQYPLPAILWLLKRPQINYSLHHSFNLPKMVQ